MKDVLVGIRAFGPRPFDYLMPKFVEMHRACIAPYADTLIVGDHTGQDLLDRLMNTGKIRVGETITYIRAEVASSYAEDMLAVADKRTQEMAIEDGYKKFVWQDIDCLYASPGDFSRLVSHDVDAVGALTCARTDPDTAIARRFLPGTDGEQVDISNEEIIEAINKYRITIPVMDGFPEYRDEPWLIECGFPGAGALCIDTESTKEIYWDEMTPRWYQRVAEGRPNICLQEWFIACMEYHGLKTYLDTRVRVFHVDEQSIANRYPGERVPLESLSW